MSPVKFIAAAQCGPSLPARRSLRHGPPSRSPRLHRATARLDRLRLTPPPPFPQPIHAALAPAPGHGTSLSPPYAWTRAARAGVPIPPPPPIRRAPSPIRPRPRWMPASRRTCCAPCCSGCRRSTSRGPPASAARGTRWPPTAPCSRPPSARHGACDASSASRRRRPSGEPPPSGGSRCHMPSGAGIPSPASLSNTPYRCVHVLYIARTLRSQRFGD